MENILNLSDDELVRRGYLVIERQPNTVTYLPTEKYKEWLRNPYPDGVPTILESAHGVFLKEGHQTARLPAGNHDVIIRDGILENVPFLDLPKK